MGFHAIHSHPENQKKIQLLEQRFTTSRDSILKESNGIELHDTMEEDAKNNENSDEKESKDTSPSSISLDGKKKRKEETKELHTRRR